ncbi:hypothetical protein [Pseudobacteriovorax antillogorgiicola]|uniref:Uncharacterized protein n=1 Tax=Pseudobacteriovorax antillogorgiicola TaxID=1513793 RepID=A0A1Y6BVH1_9BACT|nr:hypothetical protein [Pseudobacteriovorax antillogorgiicola]TCS53698.1 hypothetical protein EDD56_1077 [Pseudobacteriovorax antillogorgiicola]SMF23053.1 hypothetical protein SAMN06296036_107265 [Pseudobacteriovorax antillogorgiicola]
MKRAMASALAYLIFFEPVVRAAPNFRLAENKLKKFDLGDLGDLDIHRKLNVPDDKSLRIEDPFIGTKSSGISGGRGQPNIINIGGGFPSDRLPDWRKQPKIHIKGDNLGKSVLDALYEGKDPTIACNARLKTVSPSRFYDLQSKVGRFLKTEESKFQEAVSSLGGEAVSPPLMEGVSDCTNTQKKACSELLVESINNPRQMALNSKCSQKTVNKYEKLINSVEAPSFSISSNQVDEDVQERFLEIKDMYDHQKVYFEDSETCENQYEMTLTIIAALDGDPTSKLANAETKELMDLLKSVNPSAHEALDCLVANQDGSKIKLGGQSRQDGQLVGTITGTVYRDKINTRGAGPLAPIVACATNAICASTVSGVVIAAYAAWSSDKNAEEANRIAEESAREANRIAAEAVKAAQEANRLSAEANRIAAEALELEKKSGADQKDNSNPNPSHSTTVEEKDKKDPSKSKPIKDVNPFNIHGANSLGIHWTREGGWNARDNTPINRNPHNLHFSKGTEAAVCEGVYERQIAESSDYKHILNRSNKFTTYSQEFEENMGKESDPIDYKSNEFRGKKAIVPLKCHIQNWESIKR